MAESVSSKNHDSDSGSVDSEIPMEAAHEYRSAVMASTNQMQQQQEQEQQQQHAPLHSHAPLYHHYPPPPPPPSAYGPAGPYSAAVGNQSRSGPYPPPPPPHISSQQHLQVHSQGFQGQVPNGPSSHLPPSHHHEYHRPIPLRAHEPEYLGHHPPPANSYSSPPIGVSMYGAPPEDRRWIEGQPPPMYSAYEGPHYNKHFSYHPPPPPAQPTTHLSYGDPHNLYPPTTTNNRLEENSRMDNHEPGPASSETPSSEVESRDHGATSPSQISSAHRDEVSNMGCTCKKTKCLKLYCQCFAAKIYCGSNCRCLVCFNTSKHDKQRKDAMRIILSRNPTAFDTKFSKTKERKTKEQQSVLAHKLGCKCRKSACMKKYCECYAGNVKCSSNCRCLGCKNTPSGGFGQDKPRNAGVLLPSYEASASHGRRDGGSEPWMMNAAQNLAFLKHGSPTAEKPLAAAHDTGDFVSMPSLAASSSDTSPEERHDDTTKQGPVDPADGESSGTVNSLLLAAMAMTEFQSRNTTTDDFQQSQELPVDEQVADANEQRRKPRRPKVARASPKRKSSDVPNRNDVSDGTVARASSPGTEKPKDDRPASPLDPREMKRTRLGSVCKKMNWIKDEDIAKGTPGNVEAGEHPSALETPDPKAGGIDKLTPISARCIDFRRMHVDEKKNLEQP